MKELTVRGISGGVYIVLVLSSLFINQITFSIVIIFFSLIALIEFQRLIDYRGFLAIALLPLMVYNFYKSNLNHSDLIYPLFLNLISQFILLYLLFTNKNLKFNYLTKSLLSCLYLALGSFFIIALADKDENYLPKTVLFFYLLIWVNNSIAYLIGKKIGKNYIFKSISPKKTWEGFLAGLVFTVLTALIFYQFTLDYSIKFYIIIALLISILSTLGDLIQSKFKRYANVKDSGSLIPGHGGFFDRMDSVIFAAPWIFLVFNIKEYVS